MRESIDKKTNVYKEMPAKILFYKAKDSSVSRL